MKRKKERPRRKWTKTVMQDRKDKKVTNLGEKAKDRKPQSYGPEGFKTACIFAL